MGAEKLIRKEILGMNYYTAGRKPAPSKTGRCVKLASNENLYGTSPAAVAAIEKTLKEGLSAYPDSKMRELKAAVSAFWKRRGADIPVESLLFGDGSGEVLSMLLAAFLNPGEAVVMPEKSFILYALQTIPKGGRVVEVKRSGFKIDLGAMLDALNSEKGAKVALLANPDNPTSTFIGLDGITGFLEKVPQEIAVIIDEAYIQFAGIENSVAGLLKRFPNLVVVHTFSKIYGMAGLRVGYAAMAPGLSEQLEKIRLPFNLGALQQAGACAAVSDDGYYNDIVGKINKGREYLEAEFGRMGTWFLKSRGNFIFADLGPEYKKALEFLDENGISVRVLESFGFTGNYVRITIGRQEDNQYLAETLKKFKISR